MLLGRVPPIAHEAEHPSGTDGAVRRCARAGPRRPLYIEDDRACVLSRPNRLVTKPFDITDVLRAIDLALADSTGSDQIAQSVDSFEERRKIDRLRHESVEPAVDGVAEHVG